jgi:hypothetical protein
MSSLRYLRIVGSDGVFATRRVPHVTQELFRAPEFIPVFNVLGVPRSLVFCVVFCR